MKVLLIIKLLIVLTLQPVGLAFASAGNMPEQIATSEQPVARMNCEQMQSSACSDMSHCLVFGDSGCDFESTSIISILYLEYSQNASQKLAIRDQPYFQFFDETILRPPKNS